MNITYWHAGFSRLEVGTRLRPSPSLEETWGPKDASRILEAHRPTTAIPHSEAVFMCTDPQDCDNCGALCEWLMKVEPESSVERHDMTWATQIDCLVSDGHLPDSKDVILLAHRYWSGEASDEPVWEHLARSAKVLSVEPY